METDGLAQLIGLTVLVETGGAEATGAVTAVDGGCLTFTCDEESWSGTDVGVVQASIFAPDAMYHVSGEAMIKGLDVIMCPETTIQRIQRRKWPRRRLDLPVTVCPVEDGRRVEGVPGRTVDVGVGGVCIETLRPVEGEGDPMVILSLPDGTSIVSLTSTVGVEDLGDGWRYRLAFRNLDAHDSGRIAELVG
ncbi:MAG TPA: PilZ domain-containing protein [Acidimicrobiales bacterium]|nr:PilZ domain-containing protein [Acidimicrobiales bacterium]